MNTDDNKRIARNTAFLYIRTFVTMLIGLYTSRKILEMLGVTDFGIFNIVGGVITMLTFLNGSITTAIQRYLAFELGRKDYAAYNRVLNTSLVIQACFVGLLLLVAETAGLWFVNTQLVIPPDRMAAANWVYQASVISTVIMIMTAPFYASVTAHEKMHVTAYVGMADAVAKLLLVCLLGIVPWDRLSTWSIMFLAITVASAATMVIYSLRKFPHCKVTLRHQRSLVKSMASFSGWSIFGALAFTLKEQGANVVLNVFGGPAINAARGVAFQIKGAVMGLTGGFQNAVNPQLIKNYAADDVSATHRLMCKSSKIGYFLLLIPAIPLCFECSFILGLWLVEVPSYAVLFTILVIIETLCEVFAGPAINTLMAAGRIKWYQIVIGSVLILNVPVSYLLMRLGFPIFAPFVVSILFVVGCDAGRLWFCKRLTGLSLRYYAYSVIIPCLAVTAASLAVPTLLYCIMPQGYVRAIVLICASGVTSLLSVWTLGLDRGEREFVRNTVVSRVPFLKRKKQYTNPSTPVKK